MDDLGGNHPYIFMGHVHGIFPCKPSSELGVPHDCGKPHRQKSFLSDPGPPPGHSCSTTHPPDVAGDSAGSSVGRRGRGPAMQWS